jgi:hypothetical protein
MFFEDWTCYKARMNTHSTSPSTPVQFDGFDLDGLLSGAIADLALALGLVRVLTLLPLYDSSLDELERQLAHSLDEVWQARTVFRCEFSQTDSNTPDSK